MKVKDKLVKHTFLMLLIITPLLIVSCGSDDEPGSSNNATTFQLEAQTTSAATAKVGGGSIGVARAAAANDLVFDAGSIVIREVIFDGDNTTELLSVSRTISGTATIDYNTGEISPEIKFEVPPGDYADVYLSIEMLDEGAAPSTVITGTYTNSEGTDIPVRFEFNSGEVFEAEAATATIGEGDNLIGKITFDALDWFSVISTQQMDNAAQTEGVIIVSETSNANLFDLVADRLDVGTAIVFE